MTDGIRVLHVDDEPDFADLTATFLERELDAVTVDTALDAVEARSMLDDATYDCIVSDYDMPGENGVTLLETVRATDPTTPFILFTGKGSEEVASDAITAGATDYLQKETGTDQYMVLANRIQNVTSAARAERERERQLAAIETAHEGISILDDDVFVYVNEAYADLYGYDREAMVGEHWSLLYPDDEVDFAHDVILPTAEREGVWRGESIGLRADGSTFAEDHVVALTENDDIICTVRDKTDQKDREAALVETNTILRTVMENLPVGVLVEDADRDVLTVNDSLCDMFEIPLDPADLVGQDGTSLVGDLTSTVADPERFADRVDEILTAREPVRGEELELVTGRILVRDYVPYTLTGDPASLWIYRDLTEQREHEAALEHIHERTRRLMQTTTVAETAQIAVESAIEVAGADASGCQVLADDQQQLESVAFIDNLRSGFSEPPIYRRNDDTDPAAQVVWEAFETGSTIVIEDTHERGRLADVTPVRTAIIHPLGPYGVFIASSKAPHAFDEADRALIEIISATLTAALERSERERELRRRNERLNEFANIVSHDLRNPLNVARGRLDLLTDGDDPGPFLASIERALGRMAEIIDDTLTLAQEGQSVGETTAIDLSALAEGCWADVATADATLVADDALTIQGDRQRVKHVLENLFRNCVEHGSTDNRDASRLDDSVEHGSTNPRSRAHEDSVERGSTDNRDASQPDDGVEPASEDVTVRVGRIGSNSGFYVEDDGPGIPVDERTDVFDSGYSTAVDGTGFGLAIVKEIIEAHGWSIRATDAPGGGARFEITGVTVE